MRRFVVVGEYARVFLADDLDHAREQHLDALPEEEILHAYEQVAEPMQGEGWFVVTERSEHEEYGYAELPPYIVGPFSTEDQAVEELESDSSITYCLLTIDAKTEHYIAGGDCFVTDNPPLGLQIIPPKED